MAQKSDHKRKYMRGDFLGMSKFLIAMTWTYHIISKAILTAGTTLGFPAARFNVPPLPAFPGQSPCCIFPGPWLLAQEPFHPSQSG